MGDPHSFLDPVAISHGETLGILARSIVEGYRAGEHRSPYQTFALEFAQHRPYAPGDDMRHIDWKVLGRTDRWYIKQYEQDTNFIAHLLVDGSESMNYGSGKITKLHYAKSLAACIAYLVLMQRDAASMSIFDTEIRQYIPRTDNPGRIHDILDQLAAFKATGQTQLGSAMAHLADIARLRSIVVVMSDLFDDEAGFERGLHQLRFHNHEVIVFHILDPEELEFSFNGQVKFIGLEDSSITETSPADIRAGYLQEMNAMRERMREVCLRTGTHYVLANSHQPISQTLSSYLQFRQQVRVR
jgi:uncharacterized protein (DUF58 family)